MTWRISAELVAFRQEVGIEQLYSNAYPRYAMAPKRKLAGSVDEEIARLEAELAQLEDEEDEGEVSSSGLILTSLQNQRIPPLPKHQLPASQCREPSGAKKRKSKQSIEKDDPVLLEKARALVQRAPKCEKLKIPFACRLCAFRGQSLEEFEHHRLSRLHIFATKLYKESSYCKLCRVQCTSPLELETHVSSKKHAERLAQLNEIGHAPSREKGTMHRR